jgi:hypothetical protein
VTARANSSCSVLPADGRGPSFPIWINVASVKNVGDTPPGTTVSMTRAPYRVVEDYATVMQMISERSVASQRQAERKACHGPRPRDDV